MTDIWVCSTCHSINRQRNDRCYKCSARQSEATGELANTRVERAIATRAVVPYRSSLLRGLIASVFIVAVAVLGVVVLSESLAAVRFLRDQIPIILQTGQIDRAEYARLAAGAVVPGLARIACVIGALLFFAAWLSRVIANIPALGGGTPRATSTKAFIYPLIPVWNLFKVPPMIQEALYRLDPKAGGFFMFLLAWFGLVGSWIVSFVVGWWSDLRIATLGNSGETLGDAIAELETTFDVLVIVDIITTLMVSAGALVLVIVMLRIEARSRARDREVRAAFAAGVGLEPAMAPALPVVAAPVVAAPVVAAPPPVAVQPVVAAPLVATPPGPRLLIRVGDAGVQVSIDGDAWEASSVDELREAGAALRDAGGSAIVTATDGTESTTKALGEIVSELRGAGVPTTITS